MNLAYSNAAANRSIPPPKVFVDPTAHSLLVSAQAIATGTLKRLHLKAAANTNSTLVKNAAGQVYSIHVFNAAASIKYLKLYNKVSAPTVGTDVPVEVYPLPAGGFTRIEFPSGNPFALGIGVGITGALADNDTTAVVANDVVLNLHYV